MAREKRGRQYRGTMEACRSRGPLSVGGWFYQQLELSGADYEYLALRPSKLAEPGAGCGG